MSETSGFQPKGSIRRLSSVEQSIRQEQLKNTTMDAIFREAATLPNGTTMPLELSPHLQQSGDTCLLASVMSIAEALARRRNHVPMLNENLISQRARQLGLLYGGGMATVRQAERDQTIAFLEREFAVRMEYIPTTEAEVLARTCVQAIYRNKIPILESSFGGTVSHWVAVYGIDKKGPRNIDFKIADPMMQDPRLLNTSAFVERLLGRDGVSSQMFLVDVAEFRAKAIRTNSAQ